MITLKKFHPSHLSHIFSWLKAHGLDESLVNYLPKIGFLAFDEEKAVAAAFLRRVEGGFYLLENLISNPEMPGPLRHVCIDALVQELIRVARFKRSKLILAYSLDKGTLERSKKHGFRLMPHTMIALDLGGN